MTLRRISSVVSALAFAAALILYPPYSFFFYLSPGRRLILVFITASVSAVAAALPLLPPKTRKSLGRDSVLVFAFAVGSLLLLSMRNRSPAAANHAVTSWIIASALLCFKILFGIAVPKTAEKILFAVSAALALLQCVLSCTLWAATSAEIGVLVIVFLFPVQAAVSSLLDITRPERAVLFCALRTNLIYRLTVPAGAVIVLSCVLFAVFSAAWIYHSVINKRSAKHE